MRPAASRDPDRFYLCVLPSDTPPHPECSCGLSVWSHRQQDGSPDRSPVGDYLTSRPMRLNRTAHGEMMIRAMFGAASEEK